MALDTEIRIRINDEVKAKLEEKSKSLGLTLAAYVRSTLMKEIKKDDSE
jgi:antitoxin component of RelBE/YafQ-DinJ toxin-antitoxin module